MNLRTLTALFVGILAVVGLFVWMRTLAEPGGTEPAENAVATDMTHRPQTPSGKQRFMPMVAGDGPHYGATVQMPGHGRYRLVYTIHPPDPQQFGRHTDPVTGVAAWFEPFSVEFDFDYQGVPTPGSEEAKRRGVEVRPGFREYPIQPVDGYEENHMLINAVWLPPIRMQGMRLPQDPNVIHLEADISALPGNPNGFEAGSWIPYLRVEYALIPVE